MKTLSSTPFAVVLARVAAKSSDHSKSLASFAARHERGCDEDAADVIGAWLAYGWIEQDTTSSIEELCDGDPERFDLASGDFQAIRSIFEDASDEDDSDEDDSEELDNFESAVESAARDAWENHYKTMHAAHDLGAEHGAEHADSWVAEWRREPTNPNDPEREPTDEEIYADYNSAIKTLATMSTTANDWSNDAAEAWSLTGREETTSGEPAHLQEEIRYWYVAGYEAGARQRSGELANELLGEQMRDE